MSKLDEPDENGFTHDLIDTGWLSVNCRCLVIAPKFEEAQRLIDETDPGASYYNETHLWLKSPVRRAKNAKPAN